MGAKGFYFDTFQVDQPAGGRWSTAIAFLRDGRAIIYRGVALSLTEPGLVVVDVPAWVDVSGMPPSIVVERLAQAEAMVEGLLSDAAFAALASGRRIESRLVDESYGWRYATRREGSIEYTDLWKRHHRPPQRQ